MNNEGDPCTENPLCLGNLKFPAIENCTCFINAPCMACTDAPLVCNECGEVYYND